MNTIISVKNISKQYTLGSEVTTQKNFREMILNAFVSPFRKFRRLRGTDKNQVTFSALKNVSFDIEPGEVVGVIGRNGAGKSTLLKILSRITSPTEGRIEYQGKLASLLEVGTGFHPELTGRENIYLNGAILGMSKHEINERIDAIIEFAEIAKFLDTPVKRFSSGMYVRLAFAVAAHLEPDILVVDEVLAVGDQAFQEKCLGKLNESAKSGRTVFFVSHNMTAIKNLCTRIIYLKDGQIEYDGSPNEAISRYLSIEKSGSAIWIDEQNKHSHLKQVSLSGASLENTSLFQYDEAIRISLVLKNMTVKSFVPAVRLTDIFGNVLFTSWDKDSISEHHNGKQLTLICTIPEKLLRPSTYTLTVFLRAEENGVAQLEETNFDITVSAENCPIAPGRLGLLFPTLDWQRIPN